MIFDIIYILAWTLSGGISLGLGHAYSGRESNPTWGDVLFSSLIGAIAGPIAVFTCAIIYIVKFVAKYFPSVIRWMKTPIFKEN